MTLDEAIKREEKIEKQQMARANALDDIPLFGMNQDDKKQIEECYKCAEEHRQLAEWLKDYKRLKAQEPVLDKIRAEIEALPKTYPFINHIDTYVKEDDVKRIIDKYKAESEGV